MALSFPLSLAQFIDQLLIGDMQFDCPEQVESQMTGGGEMLRADLAPMLWSGEAHFAVMTGTEAATAEVLLDLLRPAGRSFYIYDIRRPAPLMDPTGSILGAATPTINTLPSYREVSIAGLPAAYGLRRGDYLAFDYGSPARRALHRVVPATVTANGSGVTPTFEVTPAIRPGAATGAAVSLLKASCKAVLVPNSIGRGTTSKFITRGGAFRWQQTLM